MAYKVYVSATQRGLEDYLAVVREAILRMDMHPVMWQDFSIANEQEYTVNFTRQKVDDADLFIGIYAHRYGWKPPASELSVVEMEYNWARERKMPILTFCISSSLPWPVNHIERDQASYQRLEAFKERLLNERLLTTFTTPDNLQAQVYLGLSKLSAQKDRRLGIINVQPVFGPPPEHTQFHADVFMIMPFAAEW